MNIEKLRKMTPKEVFSRGYKLVKSGKLTYAQFGKICDKWLELQKTPEDVLKELDIPYPKEVSGIEIERFALDQNYKGSNASRRCRELVNEGIIQRISKNGFVSYRYLSTKLF